MVIMIKDKEHELYFGIGFVRALDEKYFLSSTTGMKVGISLETKVPQLLAGDTITLAELLYQATCTESKGRPTQADIDRYVDEVEDIDELFREVIDELKKSNATKRKMAELQAELIKQQELIKKQAQN